MSPAVVHQLDAAAEDAVASGAWCDMQALVPSALSQDDAAALLEHCPFMQSTGQAQTVQTSLNVCQLDNALKLCTDETNHT